MTVSLAGCNSFRCQPVDAKTALARELTCGGLDAIEKGNDDRGCILLQRAVAEQPNDHRIRVHLAESLKQRGQMILAIQQMTEATKIAKDDPELHARLGKMHLEAGNISEAINRADAALAIDNRNAAAWALKGTALRRWGKNEDAMTALHRALDYQPEYTEVELELAGLYAELDRPLRALSTLDVCCARYAPGREPPEVLIQQGRMLARMNRFERAIATVSSLTDRTDVKPAAFEELCRLQQAAGDFSNARITIAQACERWPDDAGLRAAMNSMPNSVGAATAQNWKN